MSSITRRSKAATRDRAASTSIVPHWPTTCMVDGCGNDTTVAILAVKDARGRTLTGAAGQFLARDKSGCYISTEDGRVLRREYSFHMWVTRCAECYDREIRAMGRSQLDPARVLAEKGLQQ